jgi:hypothetical protein
MNPRVETRCFRFHSMSAAYRNLNQPAGSSRRAAVGMNRLLQWQVEINRLLKIFGVRLTRISPPPDREQSWFSGFEAPPDHPLLAFGVSHPNQRNLACPANLISEKYRAAIVDIGANVGDTAALIRGVCNAALVCVNLMGLLLVPQKIRASYEGCHDQCPGRRFGKRGSVTCRRSLTAMQLKSNDSPLARW